MNVSGMLTSTCDIITVVQTKTSTGSVIDTESTLASDVPCNFRQLTRNESVQYGSENEQKLYRFYFKGDQVISSINKILYKGEYYNVLNVHDVHDKADLLHVEARYDSTPVITAGYDS